VVSDFAFALTIGVIVGTYSTIYVASPLIMVMDEVKPYLNRLMAGTRVGPASATPGPDGGGGGGGTDVLDAPPDRPLTESEKRRRERAQREKADRQGGSNLA
jgi:hypothetical protein